MLSLLLLLALLLLPLTMLLAVMVMQSSRETLLRRPICDETVESESRDRLLPVFTNYYWCRAENSSVCLTVCTKSV